MHDHDGLVSYRYKHYILCTIYTVSIEVMAVFTVYDDGICIDALSQRQEVSHVHSREVPFAVSECGSRGNPMAGISIIGHANIWR